MDDLLSSSGLWTTVLEPMLKNLSNKDVFNFGQTCKKAKLIVDKLWPEFKEAEEVIKLSKCSTAGKVFCKCY